MSEAGPSHAAAPLLPSSTTSAAMTRTRSSNRSSRVTVPLGESSPQSNASESTTLPKTKGKPKAKGKKRAIRPESATGSGSKGQEDVAYEYVPVAQMKAESRKNLSYHLSVRQQPMAARMCGVGEKADRRPLDPTPVIQLQVMDNSVDPEKRKLRRPKRMGQNYMQNPYYFCFACLVSGEPDATDDELHVVENGKHRSLTGTPVSSLYHLKDLDNNDAAFFVFPDLGVRKEGRYRLKMTVYEIVDHRYVHFCDSIFTDSFTVFSAKKFPGMSAPTALSQAFQDQGLKIRVRKQTKVQMAKNKRKAEMDAEAQYEAHKRSTPASGSESRPPSSGYPPHPQAALIRDLRGGHPHPTAMAPPPLPYPINSHRPLSSPQQQVPQSSSYRPSSQPDPRMAYRHQPPQPERYHYSPSQPSREANANSYRGSDGREYLEPPRMPHHPYSHGLAQQQHHHMYGPPSLSRPSSSSSSGSRPRPLPIPDEREHDYRKPQVLPPGPECEREISDWPRPSSSKSSSTAEIPAWRRGAEIPPPWSGPVRPPESSRERSRGSAALAAVSRASVDASEESVTSRSGSRDPLTPSSRTPSSQRSMPAFADGLGMQGVKIEPVSEVTDDDAAPRIKPTGRVGLSGLLL